MAPGRGAGGDGIEDTTAKHLLDSIGKKVHDKAKNAALDRSNSDLQGFLSEAKFEKNESDPQTPGDPCQLQYEYHTNVTLGYDKENPCKKRSDVRFSDTKGAECDNRKIRDSEKKSNYGACAPYRRLHLCDQHLEKINRYDKVNNHTLLTDVCLAAKFEAESLKTYRGQHQLTNEGSQICTVLARSFADIGDIVRGKDLYLGNNKEKKQLEENLKKIFKEIYDKLDGKNGKKTLQERYKGDTTNYYQLREDWWNINRKKVWDAITCGAAGGTYFRKRACSSYYPTGEDCRCVANVPTYFDYVPQYLRWFEEWAEDFCRKKKKYVDIVKTNCRGESGKDKYCSGDGFDCTKTVRAKGIYAIGDDCHKCSFWCGFYKKWLANQKQEFLKQKKKCENEMLSISKKKQSTKYNVYEGYDEEFYKILKSGEVGGLNKFLELLKEQSECNRFSTDEGIIDFTKANDKPNEEKGTFYRSKYCEECPECGVEKKDNGEFQKKEKNNGECDGKKLYEIPIDTKHNVIPVLSFGDERDQIKNKINTFCTKKDNNREMEELTEQWKCYKEDDIKKHVENDYKDDVNGSGGICILEKTNGDKNGKKQKTFNDFFHFWVRHLLNDSIEWREGLKKCLQNDKKTCIRKCNDNCKCYESWVQQKKTEWNAIKEHFDQQKDICQQQGILGDRIKSPYFVLELVLELEYFPLIKEAYGDAQAIEGINKTLDKKKQEEGVLGASNEETIIDYLLDHELEEADKCVKKNPLDKCNQQKKQKQQEQDTGPARSNTSADTPRNGPTVEEVDSEEELENEEEGEEGTPPEENGGGGGAEAKDTDRKGDRKVKETTEVTKDVVTPACEIVDKLFQNPQQFKEVACNQKYGYPQRHWGWRCVAPSDTTKTTGSETAGSRTTRAADGAEPTRDDGNGDGAGGAPAKSGGSGATTTSSGSICVPPRRRRLYVGGLTKWAEKQSSQGGGAPQVSPSATASSGSQSDPLLLTAFVESAAIETFFLWDRYKKIKEKEIEEKKKQENEKYNILGVKQEDILSDQDHPQKKLQKSGEIPNDFLRQMFYTLGDYRDILVRGGHKTNGVHTNSDKTNIVLLASENRGEMEKIQQEIDKILKQSGTEATSGAQENSVTTPQQTLWKDFAPQIWNGMICALTYEDSGDKGGKPTQNEQVKGQLLESDGKKPKKDKYGDYDKVQLKEENDTEVKGQDGLTPQTTHLSKFVLRPPYFRYLEEWGETFCRERKKRLKQIKHECKVEENGDRRRGGITRQYSGDGESCETISNHDYSKVSDLEKPSCAKPCSSYRRWIERKKDEFIKQKDRYQTESDKVRSDNGFSKTLRNYNDAAQFLKRLKNGPCKNNDNGEGKIEFNEKSETFQHTDYCGTCSLIGVKCKKGHCDNAANGKDCPTGKITAGSFGNEGDSIGNVDMHVSDNGEKGFGDLKEACNGKGIFEGIRKDEWKCDKFCGVQICGLKKNNDIDQNQIILIRALFKRWVEYFFEDYNKIKNKISHCTKNDKKSKCISGCEEKCKCVSKWIDQKSKEWTIVRKRYLEQYKNADSGDTFPVRSFLEELIPKIAVVNDQDNVIKLSKFDNPCGCSFEANSQNKNGHKDAIDCMITKLQKKIEECQSKHSVEKTEKECQEYPPPVEDDEEDLLLQEEENTVEAPKICDDVLKTPPKQEEGEEKCEPAQTAPKKPAADSERQTPEEKLPPPPAAKEEKPPKQNAEKTKPKRSPRPIDDLTPALKKAMLSSTIMWSIEKNEKNEKKKKEI
ncbi:hypothetical protein PFNF54_01637 [Plasmodium falciparum NF54]|uniref:Erythrocyte membrane protein 1 n=1 Tax=Plasmodium falciparum (isolate NF54) TaxID=5843 RepID=W7JY51_PLAFO|nr:hypothetical protein PFNF54_01637 [Plasmodium falciparum NF54]